MALLITTSDVKTRMAIDPNLDGGDTTIASAITAAQVRIETAYDSSIQIKSNMDIFYLDANMHNGVVIGGVKRLYLSNAFVRLDPVMQLFACSSWSDAGILLDAGTYTVDTDRGIVYIDASYTDKYIRCVYSSGFRSAPELPGWLREAILGYVPVVFNFGQTTNRNSEAESNYKASGDHALSCLARYSRNIGFCHYPSIRRSV